MASTFSSSWSVTTVPTRRRTHVERLASSSAIRMYTSYSGMRSTGGADAPSGSRFRKWVLAATPSLETLMQLLIGIVVGVLSVSKDGDRKSTRLNSSHVSISYAVFCLKKKKKKYKYII